MYAICVIPYAEIVNYALQQLLFHCIECVCACVCVCVVTSYSPTEGFVLSCRGGIVSVAT